MKTEYEFRILEINKEQVINELEKLGAKKVGEFNQKRYVYNLNPKQEGKWIRLRTDGTKTTLTYKNIINNTIDGTKEIEIEVNNFETTNELLEKMGFKNKGYQENKRIQYVLENTEIDIDTWPMIPTYMEIKGKSKEDVIDISKILRVDESKITTLNCSDIYEKIYGININKLKELRFIKTES